jgi:hypothetical protein
MYMGVKVDKETKLEFENQHVKQYVKNLVLHTVSTIKGDGFESTTDTTIYLKEGDVLVFEEEGRGYIKPIENFVTVEEAISDLEVLKE